MEWLTLSSHVQNTVRDYDGTAQHMQSFSCAAGDGESSNQGLCRQVQRYFSLETPTPLVGPPASLAGLTGPAPIHSA